MTDFWSQNPKFAQQAMQFMQQGSTDQGLNAQLKQSPTLARGLAGPKTHPKQIQQAAQGHIQNVITQLQQQHGMTLDQAHQAVLQELLAYHQKQKTIQQAPGGVPNPIAALAGSDHPGAQGIVKLWGTGTDPLSTLKKNAKPADVESGLFAAAFARSPLGQQAFMASDAPTAVAAAKQQLLSQVTNTFKQITDPGGLAAQYDQYLQDKNFYDNATTAQRKAAGMTRAPTDPLTNTGFSRTSFNVPEGEQLTGSLMVAGAMQNYQKEQRSLSGMPQSGTQVEKFITSDLESAGPIGKALAKIMATGALTGNDAFLADAEWQRATQGGQSLPSFGELDPQLQQAINQISQNTTQLGKGIKGTVPASTGSKSIIP